ncbi:hypothetical protein E5A73_16745 [Sphingomonas gei]|uniref:JmjC domain-containing protein n=1 Tax=Sphingomonas gei TaxID=1395960 RepID=A0A4S1X9L5_9SPHN|nr:cupin-like domain-containing protein [Sphingomonas gei]TGX52435.1 hypothetical protein E5A73_16745 [Sphingomonas gei]
METKQIPIVSSAEFGRIADRNPNLLHENPWVVEGYIHSWPGYRQWQDLDYLRERFGDLQAFAKAPNFITNRNQKLVSVETSFEQYIRYIRQPDDVREIYRNCWLEGDHEQFVALGMPLYCGTLRIVHHANDAIFADVDPLLPAPLRAWNHALPYYYSLFNHFWLLVSLPGALTPLHVDNNGTIATIAQLSGRKRATLYSPADLCHVRNSEIGFLDPEQPDDRDFPTWRRAVKWVADLQVGQVLFVGTNWAHHVRTLDTSISVSFDFVDHSNLAAYATSAGWAAALGNRCKRNPELVAARTHGQIRREDIDELSAVTLGRCVMAHVLRSTSAAAETPELTSIRRLYLAHLEQCLASNEELAA